MFVLVLTHLLEPLFSIICYISPLVFLKVMIGWLEPLLARISGDRKRVVIPIVDEISDTNMKYKVISEPLQRGGFNWRFQYRWVSVPDYASRGSKADPIRQVFINRCSSLSVFCARSI